MAAPQPSHLLTLFDSYWFQRPILTKPRTPSPQIPQTHEPTVDTTQNLDLSTLPTINLRSYSDQLSLTTKQHSFITDSPNSVLTHHSPKLQTILSGKEVEDFQETEPKVKPKSPEKKRRWRKSEESKSKSKSKSLSELEFKELKGFMDLGFVFSEKDKGSNLVSIIPGLQRLGEEDEKEEAKVASRPYLSEAWEVLEKQRKLQEKKPLVPVIMIDPALGNEVEIKHQLRFWAHSVASVVR